MNPDRNPIERALTWLWLMQVRLLKKPAFLALPVLVPLLVLALRLAASGGGGGVVRVALCPGMDSVSRSVAAELLAEDGILSFLPCRDAAEAREAAASGRADAAWIFAADTEREIQRYAEGKRCTAVTVVEREDNVFLMLAREKLYAALFPAVSWQTWLDLIQDRTAADARAAQRDGTAAPVQRYSTADPAQRNSTEGTAPDNGTGDAAPGDDAGTEEALFDAYFHHVEKDRDIVRFSYVDGTDAGNRPGVLLSPVRGLLSLFLMLGGMAAGIFLLRDQTAGTFVWVRPAALPWLRAASILLPMGDLALAVLSALEWAGLSTGLGREALLLALLVLAGGGFCRLACRFCRTPEQISAAALELALCMLALCPVFLDFPSLRPLSRLFPPFYYLNAVHDPAYAWALAVYAGIVWLLNGAVSALEYLRWNEKP